ncbi:alpha/beta hydrolase fold [Chitinophaga filiformis]|uniref:Alpha/beta hydrolase fold n=2 Tax=Chitinophaga filiformis TaxID=104663 RepID=A0A1G7VQM4_CHIFI|nr:alpha/beta hydrolase fold [Chitinophaga filiformis]
MTELPETRYIELPEASIAYSISGKGWPLLLLHGFPETHVAWFQIAPFLEDRFMLIMPDLPGYGDSIVTASGGDDRYTKRNMARLLVAFMEKLGYRQFSLAGHDRGARVAFRLCLDFPHHVQKVAMLDIIPTADIADRLNFKLASSLGNWWLMGQPSPLPETLLAASHEFYLEHILHSWSGGKAFLILSPGANTPVVLGIRHQGVLFLLNTAWAIRLTWKMNSKAGRKARK